MKKIGLALAGVSLTLLSLSGCSKHVYRAGGDWSPVDVADVQFNDDAVQAAFEASPQRVSPARVAVYSFDTDRSAAVVESLSALPGVASVYPIPEFLLSGMADPATLRLLAAQAQCDLLVIADYGWEEDIGANGLAALNALLVPALFAPFLEVSLTSTLETYVMDVRNGFLYGAVTSRQESRDRFATIYALDDEDARDAQWAVLLEETDEGLAALLEP